MLQNIKDEGKVAKLEHRTAWMRMERAKESDSPGMATAKRRGPVKLTMVCMGTQKLRYARESTGYQGTGRHKMARPATADGETEVVLLAVYPTWVAGSSHSSGVRSGGVLVGWVGAEAGEDTRTLLRRARATARATNSGPPA